MAAITGTLLAAGAAAAASAAAGAGVNALSKAAQGSSGAGFQAQQANVAAPVSTGDVSNASQGANTQLSSQQQLQQALSAQGGLQNQSNVFGQQQSLANQLGNMAAGGGPNPAQDQLNQTTGQNVANQAALMAGQRGAGSNVGLIARQAAQQGASTQQQAVGQAATLRSQQQLGAIGALQNQQAQLANTAGSQVNNQLANQNQLTQNNLANQNQYFNQVNAQNSANISNASQANSANAGIQNTNANNTQQTTNGLASGLGTGIQAALTPKPTFSEGGSVGSQAILKESYKGKSKLGLRLAQGGKVPAMVSPGEIYLNPSQADAVAKGKMSPMAGERIPGKAEVKGDSLKNDTVKKNLDVGGVVIKRTKAKDAESAEKFVKAVKNRKK